MATGNINKTDLYDEILVQVPGAGLSVVKQVVNATLREFFVQSGAWLKQEPPLNIKAGKTDYYLDPQADGDVLYIDAIAVPLGEGFKFLKAQTEMGAKMTVTTPTSSPTAWHGYVDQPGKFTLSPAVNQDITRGLYPFVCLTLPDNRTTVPAWMLRYWKDYWLDGAIGKLMSMPDKPYTNLVTSQYYMRRFRNGMAQARQMARRQFTSADTPFQFPRWA